MRDDDPALPESTPRTSWAHPLTMIGRTNRPYEPEPDQPASAGVEEYEWPEKVVQTVPCTLRENIKVGRVVHLTHPNFGEHLYRVDYIDAEQGTATMVRL